MGDALMAPWVNENETKVVQLEAEAKHVTALFDITASTFHVA